MGLNVLSYWKIAKIKYQVLIVDFMSNKTSQLSSADS